MRKTILLTFIFLILSLNCAFSENVELKDINSIKLNSLIINNNSGFNHLTFLIEAKNVGNSDSAITIKKAVQKSLEYFFIGSNMSNKKLINIKIFHLNKLFVL